MLAAWGWLLLAAVLPRVSILVQPRVVDPPSGWLRIECRVARHPENRRLFIGVADLTDSARQIDGANDRVIHELTVKYIPCQPQVTAYCELHDARGVVQRAAQSVLVVGCGDDGESL